jgi:hypothetical protein
LHFKKSRACAIANILGKVGVDAERRFASCGYRLRRRQIGVVAISGFRLCSGA